MGVRLAAWRCRAGFRWASCTCAATEAGADHQYGSKAVCVWQGGDEEGLRQLVTMNVKTSEVQTSRVKSAGGSKVTVLAIGFFSGESCWGP